MKNKNQKIQKWESQAKIERLRDGIKERASTWSRFKKESRQKVKEQIKKDFYE